MPILTSNSIEVCIYREAPDGREIEIPVEVVYSRWPAEPDVGIMSSYIEIEEIWLPDAKGKAKCSLHWSEIDEADFMEDMVDADCDDYDEPDDCE